VHITTHWREGLQLKKGAEAVRHAPVGEPTSGFEPLTSSHFEKEPAGFGVLMIVSKSFR